MAFRKKQIYVFTWAAMGLPAHATIVFSIGVFCQQQKPTYMNLFIMVTVTPSKGRGKPPNSNIIFCCLSKLLIK